MITNFRYRTPSMLNELRQVYSCFGEDIDVRVRSKRSGGSIIRNRFWKCSSYKDSTCWKDQRKTRWF